MANNKTNPVTFIVLMGLFFLSVFGIYKGCQSCTSTTNDDMLVTISIQSDGVHIYSRDNYKEVRVKLNDDYLAELAYLLPSSQVTIPYADFSKSSGERFEFLLIKPESVYISGYKDNEKYWGYFKQK